VSAVGAGDSFVGALAWSLASGHDLEEAFRYALAAGSAALLTPGTELCRRDDVEGLHEQVELRRL
jgi:6-phosphofructokinase 2